MIEAEDIDMIQTEIRRIVADELKAIVPDPQDSDQTTELDHGPDAIWLEPDKPNITDVMSQPFPFEIVVEVAPVTNVVSCFVRNGAFILTEVEGTHVFVATNAAADEAAYTLYEAPNVITAGVTVWAMLDSRSESGPVASIVTTKPTDSADVLYVCIGKINSSGGVEQYIHDHITIPPDDTGELYSILAVYQTDGVWMADTACRLTLAGGVASQVSVQLIPLYGSNDTLPAHEGDIIRISYVSDGKAYACIDKPRRQAFDFRYGEYGQVVTFWSQGAAVYYDGQFISTDITATPYATVPDVSPDDIQVWLHIYRTSADVDPNNQVYLKWAVTGEATYENSVFSMLVATASQPDVLVAPPVINQIHRGPVFAGSAQGDTYAIAQGAAEVVTESIERVAEDTGAFRLKGFDSAPEPESGRPTKYLVREEGLDDVFRLAYTDTAPGSESPKLFNVRLVTTGVYQVYVPEASLSYAVMYNGLVATGPYSGDGSGGWRTISLVEGKVMVKVENSSNQFNPGGTWTITQATGPDNCLNAQYQTIAVIQAGGSVESMQNGPINFNLYGGDNEVTGGVIKSIHRILTAGTPDKYGAFRINGFDTPPDPTDKQYCKFLMRETDQTGIPAGVSYLSYPTLIDTITTMINGYLPLHNILNDLQGGSQAHGDPLVEAEFYHLTSDQHTNLTGSGDGTVEARLTALEAILEDFAEETVYVITGFTGDPAVPTYEQRVILSKAVPA